MLRHTIAEFFGHTLIGFTRSVAEHYNFDESKNHLELFGYYALDNTGKEWYSQPVVEVIYQEYSNGEATAQDYLMTKSDAKVIDACSTEDSEQTQKKKTRTEQWLGSSLDRRSIEPCGVHYTLEF